VGTDPSWDAPLRLLGGLHYLVLGGEITWDEAGTALDAHSDFLRGFVSEQGVQTNEVRRSWLLLPCFLWVSERTGAEQLDIVELGSSAGLNLVWDRYRYRYTAGRWGDPAAGLELKGEERSAVPARLLERTLTVGRRIGVDRSPIDLTTDEGARVLKSFIWVGQDERMQMLDCAVAALRRDPPEILGGDLAELLPEALERAAGDGLTVVFQTATFGYLDSGARERVRAIFNDVGSQRPLAFVTTGEPRSGQSGWGLRVILWPGGTRSYVAEADFHGAWLDWL
jgi:hypothetical protein